MSTEDRIAKLEKEFEELRGFADDVRSSLDEVISDLKSRAADAYDDFTDEAEDTWEDAKDTSHSLWRKTRRGAKKAYYNTIDYTQDHPWRVTSSALALISIVGIICYLASERSNSHLDTLKRRYRDYL